jgi:Family of unknown function (DUF5320)
MDEGGIMPHGDGTGPYGEGPMTGRAMGYCAGHDRPGFDNPGGGRGRRWARAGFAPAAVREDLWAVPPVSARARSHRIGNLEARAARLERQLADVLDDLERLQPSGQ